MNLGDGRVGFVLLDFLGWGPFLVGPFNFLVKIVLESVRRMAY